MTKVDNSELSLIKQELQTKSERSDIDIYVRAVQGQRTDFEARQQQFEKEFDALTETIQSELEGLKATTLASLSKKADFSIVEQLRDMV